MQVGEDGRVHMRFVIDCHVHCENKNDHGSNRALTTTFH